MIRRYFPISLAIVGGIALFFVPCTALPMPLGQENFLKKSMYNLEVNGQIYLVLDDNINCNNNILWKRRFLTSTGEPVYNYEVIRKLVKMAWVYEYVFPTNPDHIWETVPQKIDRINVLLDTYLSVKGWEKAQEIWIRTFVDGAVAIALDFTVGAAFVQVPKIFTNSLKSEWDFINLMRWVSYFSLLDAKNYLKTCQMRIDEVQGKPLKYEDAEYIFNYYMKGFALSSYGYLLNDLNPKYWHDLVRQALVTAVSEIKNLVYITPNKIYANPDVREIKDLLGFINAINKVFGNLKLGTKLPGFADSHKEFQIFYRTVNNLIDGLSMCLISDSATQLDNYVDLGSPGDEQRHNLRGWDAINPGLLPAGLDSDVTSRYQRLRSSNSVDVFVPQVGRSYTLSFRTEDGLCDDSFDVYINGSGPLYRYRHRTSSQVYPLHQVVVPSTLVTGTTVTVTFVNVASDSCGRAATYFVRLD